MPCELDEEQRRGAVRSYEVYRPGLHTSDDARWDYRIVITYNGYDGSTHESEVERALFPDRATLRREGGPPLGTDRNHWHLPIHAVDPHAGVE